MAAFQSSLSTVQILDSGFHTEVDSAKRSSKKKAGRVTVFTTCVAGAVKISLSVFGACLIMIHCFALTEKLPLISTDMLAVVKSSTKIMGTKYHIIGFERNKTRR